MKARKPSVDSIGIRWETDDQPLLQGCLAVATVSYPIGDKGDRRLETFTSGGLWGIDVRRSPAYQLELEREQLEDLRDHLEVFGVDVSRVTARILEIKTS